MRKFRWAVGERGVAMIELAGSATLFFILASGMIDVSRMILTQIAFTQISREAVRLASGNKQLEPGDSFRFTATGLSGPPTVRVLGSYNFTGTCYLYGNGPRPTYVKSHQQRCLIETLNQMIAARRADYYIYWDTLVLVSKRFNSDTRKSLGAENDTDVVDFEIQAEYEGIFPLFKNRVIKARATASII